MEVPRVRQPGFVLLQESRLFEVDFAYIDFVFSCILLVLLYVGNKRLVFRSSYYFGLFAFWADYFLYYLVQGTRTIEMVNGDPPMTTFGTFCWFFWFDTINGADIVVWALIYLQDLFPNGYKRKEKTSLDKFILFFIPSWFWLTPPASRAISLDDRLILATRPSEKNKYYVLCFLFILFMRFKIKLSVKDIARVFFSGIVCGLIHHAPLFVFGMRGYVSPVTLVITLLSEWPPIMCGLFVITYELCLRYPRNVTEKTE